MIPFTYRPNSGSEVIAHYEIEGDVMHVLYKDDRRSTALGVNEIGNAFLRENLLRTMMAERQNIPLA
ncbi:hypothetical protein LJR030_002159 [Rhizobium sp. LjRoot30]|uniref:hypothetical protein n=1 Tax=Rhizobium sp. LjRoot30 TaxID=3342320 RepID=UPI003ECDD406